MVLAENEVERALVVVAHPDDVDFWAGGTVACWTSAGIAVTYYVLSDGDSIRRFLGRPSQISAELSRRPQPPCSVCLTCGFLATRTDASSRAMRYAGTSHD
jgi:hypothetical protein